MHPVENIMRTTMEQLKEMVDVNTVIGKPILTAGETMILPVSRLSDFQKNADFPAMRWRLIR